MDSSASNHVTGLENGSESGWWRYTDGQGNSSSTSGGGSWSDSYDETVTDPGFYEGAYYGLDYGGGPEEYFAYLGDAFSDYPGSDTGFFPFAYRREEPLFGQAQGGNQRPIPADVEVNSAGDLQCSGSDTLRESAGRAEVYVAATSPTPMLGRPGEKTPSAPSRETGGSGKAIVMAPGEGGVGNAPTGGWSNRWWEGTKAFSPGLVQGAANIVNGVQDTLVGAFNVLPGAVNAIAWAEERVGILNAADPIRVPYIPSPDWSRGLITREGGTPGSWSDTHGWSKSAGATGVEAAVGAWAVKAARARQAAAILQAGTRASRLGLNVETLQLTETVAGHLPTRPYLTSRLLVKEIIEAADPTADPLVPGAWRWVVQGSWNGKRGIYELVIDPGTNRILHFLWRRSL